MKKCLSWILVFAMCLSLFPGVALAEEPEEPAGEIAPVSAPAEEEAPPSGEGTIEAPAVPAEPVEEQEPLLPEAPEEPVLPEEPVISAQEEGIEPAELPEAAPAAPLADDLQEVTDSGACGENLTWSLENGVLTISGTGAMTDWDVQFDVPWYDQRTTISEIVLPDGLTSIGDYAFYGCSSLTGVTIPEGVIGINSHAFTGCSSLASVTIPSSILGIGDSAFDGCDQVTKVYIEDLDWWLWLPDSDGRSLPHGDLYLNGKLVEELIVPDSITAIRHSMFKNMRGLLQLSLPYGLLEVGDSAMENCSGLISVTFPSTVTSIGAAALKGCSALNRIRFNGVAPTIAADAFTGVTAVANFPTGNTGWPASLRQPYGGSITWKALPFGECGNYLSWNLDTNGILTISGYGEMWSWNETEVPWYTWRENIAEIRLPAGLTYISSFAFSGCKYVTELSIPASVKNIGSSAFRDCAGLKSIRIPDGVTEIRDGLFSECTALTDVVLPDSVERIGYNAFSGCFALKTVTFPANLTYIGGYAFQECRSLDAVTLPYGLVNVENQAFYACYDLKTVSLPSTLISIGYSAFGACNQLEKVFIDDLDWWMMLTDPYGESLPHADLYLNGQLQEEIIVPEGILGLRPNMFVNMKSLRKVSLPASIRVIERGAFSGCENLTSVGMQEGLTAIGGSAFYACTGLESITIPSTVTEIGDCAFQSTGLKTVTIRDGVKKIGRYAFCECPGLESVTIPASVTEIGQGAFQHCTGLKSVTLPDGVNKIEDHTFCECTSLESITIPASVTEIGQYAFQRCSGLESVELPGNLSVIESYTFERCVNLKAVTIPASVTEIQNYAFGSIKEPLLIFLGDAPSMDTVFTSSYYDEADWYSVHAVALYPADNASWTADKLQDYGAERTSWVGYREQPVYYTVSLETNTDTEHITLIKGHGVDLVLDYIPALYGYDFAGWALEPDSEEIAFAPSASCSLNEDLTLYAVWKRSTFTVTFDANGGTGAPEPQIKTFGEDLILSDQIPTRAGYHFVGWSMEPESYGSYNYSPGQVYTDDQNLLLYAVWSPKPYTIHFNANGGYNAPDTQYKYHDEDIYLSSQTPYRDGYAFLGWATEPDAVEAAYAPGYLYTANEDISFYAVWKIREYTVSYDANGGEGAPEPQTKRYGEDLTLSDVIPTREGYIFLGWATEPYSDWNYSAGSVCSENRDLVLYAVWQLQTYLIRYDANGGYNTPADQNKYYGQDINLSYDIPYRDGYDFLGWATEPDAVEAAYAPGYLYTANEDISFYAVWKIREYAVFYDANGGEGAPEPQTKRYDESLNLSDTVPTRTGYIFQGWCTDPNASGWHNYNPGDVYTNNESVTLYAVWQPETYAIVLHSQGGTWNTCYKTYGEPLLLHDVPWREGYDFLGWSRDPEAPYVEFSPDSYYYDEGSADLYAVWQIQTYQVVYVVGANAYGPSEQTKTWGEDLVLSDIVPEAYGYEFLGWSLNNQSGIPDYQPGDTLTINGQHSGERILLYALWQAKVYLVSYHPNGGEDAPLPQLKTHGRPLTLSTAVPRRSGYNFLGWSTGRYDTEPMYRPGDRFTENADLVLYAVWERADHSVPTESALTLRDATGCIGREFSVDLMMEKNPGVMFLSFTLDYDDAVLTFIGLEDAAFTGWTVTPKSNSLVWDGESDRTDNGCLAHLRFRVKDGVELGSVGVSIIDLRAANYQEEVLQIQAGSCLVTVSERHPGDVDGDGDVDGLDLIRLRKYMARVPDVEIVEGNADVNGDKVLDIKDLIRLRKYLAKDEVILE